MNQFNVLLLLLAAVSAAAGQVLFKIGADGQTRFVDYLNGSMLLGAVFYLVGMMVWIYVLSSERLTDVYAFTALTFVFVYIAGVVIVGEKLLVSTVTGIVLILIGLYLIVARPGLG